VRFFAGTRARRLEHRRAEIDAGNVQRRIGAQEMKDDVARAATEVEYASAVRRREQGDRAAAPRFIEAGS